MVGFRDNFSPRLSLLVDESRIALLNDYWPTLCEIPGYHNLLPADFDAKLKEAQQKMKKQTLTPRTAAKMIKNKMADKPKSDANEWIDDKAKKIIVRFF